ncbi:unnamed protein product [Discula destructiva]
MARVPRESSFMPAIKCSNCGYDVEISMMGDHICGGAGPKPAPISIPTAKNVQERLGGVVDTFMPIGRSVHDKIGAIPPVDTAMANRSYSRNPHTPLSLSSGSKSASPSTPGARPSMGRADDYFPQINDGHNSAQSTRPGGYGGFEDVDAGLAHETTTSPNKHALNLLNRIEGIAAGPYAAERDGRPAMAMANNGLPRRPSRPSEDRGRPAPSTTAPRSLPKNTGYGGLGPPGTDDPDFMSPHRAQTFPVPSAEKLGPPMRAPSAPGSRPDNIRDTSRPPPPRTSLLRIRTKNPSINLDAEFGTGNPYHSPSPSVASSQSRGSSHVSQPSSSTSPARSAPSDNSPTAKSPTSHFESLLKEVKTPMNDMQPKTLPPTPDMEEESTREKQLPQLPIGRYDPAIQGGRPPSPPPSRWDQTGRQDPAVQGERPPTRSRDLHPSPVDARRDTGAPKSRGNCRACGEAITGKSISSADGRLSGRYHKACFTCTSCYEPFQTAEFYVHGDRPYCKRHYHKMNGSLCGTCKDGIEGQYLEDERATKYHVQCFRCGDCQRVLHDGYFDVNGLAYCERDAWRRLQATRRTPSMSSQTSQRSYGSSPLAPPGRPGMRPPPGGYRPGMPGNGNMGPPMFKGPGPGVGLGAPMPRMEKRRTRLGMMGGP